MIGGELRVAEVATGEAGAGDEEFAVQADGGGLQAVIEKEKSQVTERKAERTASRKREKGEREGEAGGVNGRFDAAVHTDEAGVQVAVVVEPGEKRGEVKLFTTEKDEAQMGEGTRGCVKKELAKGGGSLVKDSDMLACEQREEGVRGAGGQVGEEGEACAGEEGSPEFPDGEIQRG